MIILASASPARSQLLTQWGIPHQVIPTDLDEEPFKQSISDPKTLVETLAQAKANHLTTCLPDHLSILAADTIIYFNGQQIGKPIDRNDAKRIISLLQGQTHQVWTGVSFANQVFSDVAAVTFKPMTESQIETYLDTNDWVDKAGAYQIQRAIKPYVASIVGDICTVIGLPTKTKQQLITS